MTLWREGRARARLIWTLAAWLLAAASADAAPRFADATRAAFATYRAGRPRDALAQNMAAIRANPNDGWARLLQAKLYLAIGDGVAAEAELDRAHAAAIPLALTTHLRAEALLLEDAPSRALDLLDAEPVAARFAGDAARMRGRALLALDDLPAAGAAFDDARRRDPLDAAAWIDTAAYRRAAGDVRGAIEAADRAVSLDPRDVAALVAKGEAARTQYGLLAALDWFARALAVDPRNVPALVARAATEGDLGRTRAMLATTRAVIAIDPRNADAFYLQAVLAARARNFVLARALLARAGDGLADRPSAMLLAGVIACETGNPEQAIARLTRLVEMQPDNLKARRILAAAQWRGGDADGVVETLAPVADAPRADRYTLTLIGRALERTGRRDRAAAYLDRAAVPAEAGAASARAPDPARLAVLRAAATATGGAAARVALVGAMLQGGMDADAVREAAQLRDANPGVPAAHLLVGDALAAGGRYGEAANAYRQAANLAFTEPTALRLIDALRRSGQGVAAQRVLGLYLAQNPRSVAARLWSADLLLSAGRWAEAIPVLEALGRRIGPRDAALASNLAWAYFRSGRRGDALALAADAYRIAPANATVSATYGWLLHASGRDRARGLALLRQGADQAPRDPGARWRLAQAYAADGRTADARSAAQAALALPGFGQAGAARALLARL